MLRWLYPGTGLLSNLEWGLPLHAKPGPQAWQRNLTMLFLGTLCVWQPSICTSQAANAIYYFIHHIYHNWECGSWWQPRYSRLQCRVRDYSFFSEIPAACTLIEWFVFTSRFLLDDKFSFTSICAYLHTPKSTNESCREDCYYDVWF
jgi:hypothetical protein